MTHGKQQEVPCAPLTPSLNYRVIRLTHSWVYISEWNDIIMPDHFTSMFMIALGFCLVFKLFILYEYICMNILLVCCMYMCLAHAWCQQRPEHCVGCPQIGVKDGCELPCGCKGPESFARGTNDFNC